MLQEIFLLTFLFNTLLFLFFQGSQIRILNKKKIKKNYVFILLRFNNDNLSLQV